MKNTYRDGVCLCVSGLRVLLCCILRMVDNPSLELTLTWLTQRLMLILYLLEVDSVVEELLEQVKELQSKIEELSKSRITFI